jgi:hypothetical protein
VKELSLKAVIPQEPKRDPACESNQDEFENAGLLAAMAEVEGDEVLSLEVARVLYEALPKAR